MIDIRQLFIEVDTQEHYFTSPEQLHSWTYLWCQLSKEIEEIDRRDKEKENEVLLN